MRQMKLNTMIREVPRETSKTERLWARAYSTPGVDVVHEALNHRKEPACLKLSLEPREGFLEVYFSNAKEG